MSSTDKVAEYFDGHGAQDEREPMNDSTQKLKSYGVEKVNRHAMSNLKWMSNFKLVDT